MQYVYLNNVRGFTSALIPVRACNFLVGENSTGKSSFLALLRLVSRPDFYFKSQISLELDDSSSAFSDLVSAWSKDKAHFDIGLLDVGPLADSKLRAQFSIHRFVELDGTPVLHQYIQRRGAAEIHLRFTRRATEFYRTELLPDLKDDSAAIESFRCAAASLDDTQRGFEKFPKQFGGFPPLGLALSVASSLQGKKRPTTREFQFDLPTARQLTWIAPIRSRPQRIYNGLSKDYSAEGAHAPFVLKQQLKSKQFVEKLREFGETSGLFEVISTHTFGKGVRNPFEVLIQLSGQRFNIENVGYGVSQVMPLVVEFLARRQGRRFAVQQPEVHLHPRAQAALGSLLFFLAMERQHSFVVETHSDYLIDRFRLEMSEAPKSPDTQVLFFERRSTGNSVTALRVGDKGHYPTEQPPAFRDFFVREEMRLLSL